jgi:hypothetical protein
VDWTIFCIVYGVGVLLVVLQGIASWKDGYFSQLQLYSRAKRNSWAFIEHGGMWSDVFVISPIVAFAVSKYQLHYFSTWGLVILFVAIVLSLAMGELYKAGGAITPEAHTHDGKTTVAGWIHGIFAVAAIWIVSMVYIGLTTPAVSKTDIIVFSILLTPFSYLGSAKFNKRWKFDKFAKRQCAVVLIAIWAITFLRPLWT